MNRKPSLELWTIYDHPLDYPEGFIARRFVVDPEARPTAVCVVSPTLEGVRRQLPPDLYRIPREPGDDPTIVETWL